MWFLPVSPDVENLCDTFDKYVDPTFYEGELTGEVTIDGVNTASVQPHEIADKIGSVFQNPRSQFLVLIPIVKLYLGWKIRGCLIPKWYSDTKRLSENFILRS